MAGHCERCGYQVGERAKFCKKCGTSAASSEVSIPGEVQGPMPPGPAVEVAAPAADSQFCEYCRARVSVGVQFCKRCGRLVVGNGAAIAGARRRERVLPPRELRRPTGEAGARTVTTLPSGSKVAALGGLVALIGCFLPLASGVGENTSIVPALTKETAYALLAPLSAIAVAVMAWSAASGSPQSRVMLGGSVIALGSPWAVLWLLAILAATKAISALGPFGGGGGIGVGVFALAAGFAAAVVGGFIVLRESVAS